VQGVGDSVVGGAVGAVCKLERVQGGWDDSLAQGDVEDVREDVCLLVSTVPEHTPRYVVWTCTFSWVDSGIGPGGGGGHSELRTVRRSH